MANPKNDFNDALEEKDFPIQVYFGNAVLDMGMVSVPQLFLLYYRYLRHKSDFIKDEEAMFLVQVMAKRSPSETFRVGDLPLESSRQSLDRYKTKLRRMGVVFTRRIFYPVVPGQQPVMKAQEWDLRSLFYNLNQVANKWLNGQKK